MKGPGFDPALSPLMTSDKIYYVNSTIRNKKSPVNSTGLLCFHEAPFKGLNTKFSVPGTSPGDPQ